MALHVEAAFQRQSTPTSNLLSSFSPSHLHHSGKHRSPLALRFLLPATALETDGLCGLSPGNGSPLSQGLGFQTLPIPARGVSPHADPAGHSSKPPTGKTGKAAPALSVDIVSVWFLVSKEVFTSASARGPVVLPGPAWQMPRGPQGRTTASRSAAGPCWGAPSRCHKSLLEQFWGH